MTNDFAKLSTIKLDAMHQAHKEKHCVHPCPR